MDTDHINIYAQHPLMKVVYEAFQSADFEEERERKFEMEINQSNNVRGNFGRFIENGDKRKRHHFQMLIDDDV
ncbi:hypothetical protein BLOT_013236 [Blomia tropicalis]|nr:hypothetical protein BLOT_013236 [Blomia tropicalis]